MDKRKYIISLGSVNVDIQLRIERWPRPGETLPGRDFLTTGGGKAANVAFLLHKLGLPVKLVARTGEDRWAQLARQSLEESGVDIRLTKALPGYATGAALIAVLPNGDKAILLAANANDGWPADDTKDIEQILETAAPGSLLVIDLEISTAIVKKAMETARKNGHKVILDPSPADRMQSDLYPLTDFITPNKSEAELLTGKKINSQEEALAAGDALVGQGAGLALVKLGKEGCAAVGQGHREVIPTIQVEVTDKTGAGDAFAGGLAAALFENRPLPETVRFANITSALAVTGYGSQPSYPSRKEIENLL